MDTTTATMFFNFDQSQPQCSRKEVASFPFAPTPFPSTRTHLLKFVSNFSLFLSIHLLVFYLCLLPLVLSFLVPLFLSPAMFDLPQF